MGLNSYRLSRWWNSVVTVFTDELPSCYYSPRQEIMRLRRWKRVAKIKENIHLSSCIFLPRLELWHASFLSFTISCHYTIHFLFLFTNLFSMMIWKEHGHISGNFTLELTYFFGSSHGWPLFTPLWTLGSQDIVFIDKPTANTRPCMSVRAARKSTCKCFYK